MDVHSHEHFPFQISIKSLAIKVTRPAFKLIYSPLLQRQIGKEVKLLLNFRNGAQNRKKINCNK
jgi:hypothetical protein